MDWIATGVTAALGLYMAWAIGANDVANSMGPAVGSRALSIRTALITAAICEFGSSVLVGTDVTDTVRKGIVEPTMLVNAPALLCLGMACALLGSAVWLPLSSWLGMPVSTARSIVGAVAVVVDVVETGSVHPSVRVPLWMLALGGTGIVFGLATFGYKVMRTIGNGITEITPSRAVAVNIATATVVLGCTRLRLPVSTTHTIVGAILGVGLARGLGAVNRQVTRSIFSSWLLTVPAAAVITVAIFLFARWLGVGSYLAEIIRAGSHAAAR